MGYTNYWYISDTFNDEEWGKITTVAKALVDDPIITGWNGEESTPAEVNEKCIGFNGVGDDSHESFVLVRDVVQWEKNVEWASKDPEHGYFFFCKTVQKPYDEHVWKMLCAARNAAPTKITISNDGVNGNV